MNDKIETKEEEFDPDHWDKSCQTLQTKFNTGWEWLENNE